MTGIEVPDVYDGALIWSGSCGHEWPAVREGDPRYDAAVEIIEQGRR